MNSVHASPSRVQWTHSPLMSTTAIASFEVEILLSESVSEIPCPDFRKTLRKSLPMHLMEVMVQNVQTICEDDTRYWPEHDYNRYRYNTRIKDIFNWLSEKLQKRKWQKQLAQTIWKSISYDHCSDSISFWKETAQDTWTCILQTEKNCKVDNVAPAELIASKFLTLITLIGRSTGDYQLKIKIRKSNVAIETKADIIYEHMYNRQMFQTIQTTEKTWNMCKKGCKIGKGSKNLVTAKTENNRSTKGLNTKTINVDNAEHQTERDNIIVPDRAVAWKPFNWYFLLPLNHILLSTRSEKT